MNLLKIPLIMSRTLLQFSMCCNESPCLAPQNKHLLCLPLPKRRLVTQLFVTVRSPTAHTPGGRSFPPLLKAFMTSLQSTLISKAFSQYAIFLVKLSRGPGPKRSMMALYTLFWNFLWGCSITRMSGMLLRAAWLLNMVIVIELSCQCL